ncbi:MAG TPA: hypothetical protein PLR83_01370 [Pyrinomonadaceae bacterium]|nr:hypothetical protein [Pyrinomonadaceae bacterium]
MSEVEPMAEHPDTHGRPARLSLKRRAFFVAGILLIVVAAIIRSSITTSLQPLRNPGIE